MAKTADSHSLKGAPTRAPISTHRAFPAIVALWFAALLGIGSLVLPVDLVGRLVQLTDLAVVFPSAAPPLGFTARIGIALACAIGGALTGLVLARKVARSHVSEMRARTPRFEQVRPCRPIQVHDELGEEGLGTGSDAASPSKRRVLAMAEGDARSSFLQTVPLPGLADGEAAPFAEPSEVPEPLAEAPELRQAEPLELAPFADLDLAQEEDMSDNGEAPVSVPDEALEALRSRIHTPVEATFPQDQPMTTDRPNSEILQAFEPARDAVDPLPFAPPSLRRDESVRALAEESAGEQAEQTPPPQLSVVEQESEPEDAGDDRPLAELGLVQLAARLGASLAKRRAAQASRQAATAPAMVPPLAGAEGFDAAEAEDAARAIADFFGPASGSQSATPASDSEPDGVPVAVPVSLLPWTLEGDDDGDDERIAESFSLPLGNTRAAAPSVEEQEADEADNGEADEGDYSSLLAMKNPFARQQEFVRVEEPADDAATIEPTVTFPSPAPERLAPAKDEHSEPFASRPFDPPQNRGKTAIRAAAAAPSRDPGDAERNLRDALATLQRMSGTA